MKPNDRTSAEEFILTVTRPGGKTSVRRFPSVAGAYLAMAGEYYDELENDSHATVAQEGVFLALLCSTSAVVRWNAGTEYRWDISRALPEKKTYEIRQTLPGGAEQLLATVRSPDILDAMTRLRSIAFDIANGGRHGDYPRDGTFNDAVEAGFDDKGEGWTALDGTRLRITARRTITRQ